EINSLLRKIKALALDSQDEYAADWIDITALQIVEKLIAMRSDNDTRFIEKGIRRIASYFNLNFTREIDLDELLKNNGFSHRNFYRHWKKFYNAGPAEYVQELKLEYAKTLLLETTRSVFDISQELNYNNSYYLCRLFKTRFGITPHQYRKQFSSPR
ncbi:MAG: helix-turn-helix transcriptional regulator, partial [Victivallales bacterium]|nr:helix-turn-helix transcriptional regulator [Victivallales bacterium]